MSSETTRIPGILQISKEYMKNMSMDEVRELFRRAKIYGCEDEFADWFWTQFQEVRVTNPKSLQDVLFSLENYKRKLGREYDKTHSIYVAMEYNSIELQIQDMMKRDPKLIRKSQIYMIPWKR